MHILIAGVGWLGRGIARECLANGWRVSGVKRTPGGLEELAGLGVAPVVADLADPRSMGLLPRDLDAIVACQAASGDAPDDYRRAYLDVNRNLLELAGASRARALVYTSSTGVFGQRDGSDVDETTPAQPAGESSEILVEAERLVLGAGGPHRPPLRALRSRADRHDRPRAARRARARAGGRGLDELLPPR